jgi:hypothetical protein
MFKELRMYLTNKYSKWYHKIIENAKLRNLSEGIEKHHIIPKSLGGSNLKQNIARLTPREHFVCHMMLTKMTQGKDKAKMINAALRPANDHKGRCVNSRIYSMIKIERARYLSETTRGSDNSFFGKKHTEETKKKMSDARRRWSYTEEHINKFKGRIGPMTGKNHSDETKKKLSAVGKLRQPSQVTKEKTSATMLSLHLTRSAETKEKMSLAKTGIQHPRKTCQYCGKNVTVAMFARWHGENCRVKDIPGFRQTTE